MILVLIPVAAVVLGVGAWLVMRGMGVLNVLGAEPSPAWRPAARERAPANLRERIEDVPRGCLLSVLVACGVWIVGWLILLVIGLSLLS